MMDRHAPEPQRCETVFRRLVDRTGDTDSDANELLKCFFRGYGLDRLRELLRSDDPEVAKSGAWIASELGARAKPLFDDMVLVLDNPVPYARFFAIDAILSCAGRGDGPAIARVIRLLDDPDNGVRWKVVQFLSRASREQIESASNFIDDALKPGLQCLVGVGKPDALLASDSAPLRKMALAAAMRVARTSRVGLDAAAASSDAEVREWAAEAISEIH